MENLKKFLQVASSLIRFIIKLIELIKTLSSFGGYLGESLQACKKNISIDTKIKKYKYILSNI